MDLGQKVFYLEAKTKDIKEGILVGDHISETGYWICQIFNQELNKKLSIEKAHVHETKEFAEHHRDTVSTFIDEAQAKADEANKYVDEKERDGNWKAAICSFSRTNKKVVNNAT
jgi:hypothetical protein